MVFALPENEGSARRGARPSHPLLSRALGESLRPMAGKHSGLVHQPPGLVGASHTSMVPETEVTGQRSKVRDLRRHRFTAGFRKLDSRPGHTRHLVFIMAVGL